MFESEDVRTVDERANGVQILGGTDSLVDGHQTGRPILGLDEDPRLMPSAIALSCIMRASCPPPMTATVGGVNISRSTPPNLPLS